MENMIRCGRWPNPMEMGSEWNQIGPNVCDQARIWFITADISQRFRSEHDHFWQDAHRMGEGWRQGPWWPPHSNGPNRMMFMQQQHANDLDNWID